MPVPPGPGIIKQKSVASRRSWTLEQFNKIKSIQSVMNKYTKESNPQGVVDSRVSLDVENSDK